MMNGIKRVCIFVDGENLRHNIVDLFPPPTFYQNSYLPRTDWSKFFDWITSEVAGERAERVRAYWYVVQNIDYAPANLNAVCHDKETLTRLLKKSPILSKKFNAANQAEQKAVLDEFANLLYENRGIIQNGIAQNCISVEFRRAGSIRYDLLRRELGSEKAVDVKLATDLIKLKDIYDVAIIVSGDQDYVPAVDTIKDYGKHVVNVAFLTKEGGLLPGGARRLNQATDSSLLISHTDLATHLDLKK
jgi:uncharacterized LabA/DUF88 family protein